MPDEAALHLLRGALSRGRRRRARGCPHLSEDVGDRYRRWPQQVARLAAPRQGSRRRRARRGKDSSMSSRITRSPSFALVALLALLALAACSGGGGSGGGS